MIEVMTISTEIAVNVPTMNAGAHNTLHVEPENKGGTI